MQFNRKNKSSTVEQRGFKFALITNREIDHVLSRTCGCGRFVFNRVLTLDEEHFQQHGKHLSYNELCALLPQWKKQSDTSFLGNVSAVALQSAVRRYVQGRDNFFSDIKKLKAGIISKLHFHFPKLKKRGQRDSFTLPGGSFWNGDAIHSNFALDETNSRIFIGKIGWLRYRKSRNVSGKPCSLTVSRQRGKWTISVICEFESQIKQHPSSSSIGIDMGVARQMTLSDGSYVQLSDTRKLDRRLKNLQRHAHRKQQKYSHRWQHSMRRIASLHGRIAAINHDARHKATTNIAEAHRIVFVEDLNVVNMTKSAKGTLENPGRNVKAKSGLNRSILKQGWGEIVSMLDYKLKERCGLLVKVPAEYTSQTCSHCGCVDKENRKSQEKFVCQHCGYVANADVNAAVNIRSLGHRLLSGTKLDKCAWSRTGLERSAMKRESPLIV